MDTSIASRTLLRRLSSNCKYAGTSWNMVILVCFSNLPVFTSVFPSLSICHKFALIRFGLMYIVRMARLEHELLQTPQALESMVSL